MMAAKLTPREWAERVQVFNDLMAPMYRTLRDKLSLLPGPIVMEPADVVALNQWAAMARQCAGLPPQDEPT